MLEQAKWIACGPEVASPILQKRFTAHTPGSGKITVSGLGYFMLFLNGKRVGNDYFVPALSDYQRRDFKRLLYPISDTFSHRIYVLEYDLTDYLKDGENLLEVWLGDGFYRQTERDAEGTMAFDDRLKAIFSLEWEDTNGGNSLCSDGSETYIPSFIQKSQLFTGETQDARLLAEQPVPRPVTVLPAPDSILQLQTCPPDRIIRTLRPVLLREEQGKRIYDAQENISGFASVTVSAPAGTEIVLTFSEELGTDGSLDPLSTGSDYTCTSGVPQIQQDVFICDGKARTFTPQFVWHTFRYLEVSGPTDDIEICVVHTDVPVTSRFDSDSEALNWLYDAYLRTQLDNMHGGVPSDCPHRERLGYTGDGQLTASSAMLLLDSRRFYEKWLLDILDCQDRVGGHVQHTAPFMGGGGGPGGWGCAIIFVSYWLYRYYGLEALPVGCYPAMQKWVDYLLRHSENGLVVREEEGGWCLGDWAAIGEMVIPAPYVNSCLFVKALQQLVELSVAMGHEKEADGYQRLAETIKEAILSSYFDPATGSFCDGVQGADCFALDIGLNQDPRTAANLAKRYRELQYFDTGFIGTDILVDVLFRYGYGEVAWSLLTTEKEGGYLWQKRHGATTIWEYMNGACSHCHPMFGAPVRQLFTRLLGIGYPNADNLTVSPVIPREMHYASGSVTLPGGIVEVYWKQEEDTVCCTVSLPEKMEARFLYGETPSPLYPGQNIIYFKRMEDAE